MISRKMGVDFQSKPPKKWDYIVFIVGVMSVFLDFFFMYIPCVGSPNSLYMDWHLGVRLAFLRSFFDTIFLCDIVLKFRTQYMVPNAFQRGEVNKKPTYSKLTFMIDLLAIIPLPQFIVAFKIDELFGAILFQVPFKVIAMSPYPHKTIKASRILTKNAWLGALQNLFYFIMISNGLGALYYAAYIDTLEQCGIIVYDGQNDAATLAWDVTSCTENYGRQNGIYSEAIKTNIGTRSFIQKYTYCFAWGLKSLSSFGQIFSADSYFIDAVFSLLIVVSGLLLFGDLLAKMQTALQCTEVKEDRQRTRQRMVEEWMKYHQLPQPLKKQVKQAIQSEWSATRGINDEAILDSFPWDMRSNVCRHLYLEIIRTMPLFEEMDDDLVNAICGHLRTFTGNNGTYVAFEGEPVHHMLFVFSGQLEVLNHNDSEKNITLGAGDLCGKELLEWCSHPTTSTENLKPATQTIKCITDVDAFALRVDEVKLLAIQFHRDGKFRHAFRRYAT